MVFVTGGTGFVGRAILRALAAEGHPVRVLVRPGHGHRVPRLPGLEVHFGDVTEVSSLRGAATGCEAVIHLVGIIRERAGFSFQDVHIRGTENVLAEARRAGVKRFVHMSALGARPGAATRYHVTKWAAEQAVRSSGIDFVIFRPAPVFGQGDQLFMYLASVLRWSPVMPVFGHGDYLMQPVYVDDVAQYFVRALDNQEAAGQIFELGGPDVFTYKQVLQIIMRASGRRRPLVRVPAGVLLRLLPVVEGFPVVPITRDQLVMLMEGSVVSDDRATQVFPMTLHRFEAEMERILGR